MTDKSKQNKLVELPNTLSINVTLGLKHCNKNKALYYKVLNNFVKRYQDIDLNSLKEEELIRTIHSLKGLSATLGMTQLSEILSELESTNSKTIINKFENELKIVCQAITII